MFKKYILKIGGNLAPKAFPQFSKTYSYRIEVVDAKTLSNKIRQLLASFWKVFVKKKTIFFFPERPLPFCVIFKILMFLGIRVETNPREKCDLAIHYWHGFDGNPYATLNPFPSLRMNGDLEEKRLNIRCRDISKDKINKIFEEIFGYPISVDPRKFQGKCVRKSNWNALHKGKTVECPREPEDGDFVYQKLVHNETNNGYVEDMRVPIYGKKTPLVYLKYRLVQNRFIDRAHTNTKVRIVEPDEVLSGEEIKRIFRFSEKIGLDYGEVDVLRDQVDGRIYIVDANIAPSGPPTPISSREEKRAIRRLAQVFERSFCA